MSRIFQFCILCFSLGDLFCSYPSTGEPCANVHLFNCENGRYLLNHLVCNGDDDCGNQADEKVCVRSTDVTPLATSRVPFIRNNSLDLKEEETIYSPNYPNDYPHNANVVWNVTTAPGHKIKVVFNDFELEDSNECGPSYDFLKFYDGRDKSSPLLGTYCHHDRAQYRPLTSSSNAMVVHFKSDHSIAWRGFHLTLTTVCGGDLQAQTDENFLVSHTKFGEKNYGGNASCDWIIRSHPEKNIEITFSDFEVDTNLVSTDTNDVLDCEIYDSGNCARYDEQEEYVEIYDGRDANVIFRIGKYFGNRVPTTITSRGDELLVRFRSGPQGYSRGFRASYKEV